VGLEVLNRTAHLIKARSVASGAAQCIFLSRLVESFGARSYFQSIVPGKGNLIHQILAMAFPRIMLENVDLLINKKPIPIDMYVDKAVKILHDGGIISEQSRDVLQTVRIECQKMLRNVVKAIPEISERIGLNLSDSRVYTEFQIMSYKLHIWGVLDALIEDFINKKAIIIDWKTSWQPIEGTIRIQNSDLAQVYSYALLEADRLNFSDLRQPINEGEIVPIIVRTSGNIPVYCKSAVYMTADTKLEIKDMIDKIILTAEHLTLSISNIEKLAGRSFERDCRIIKGKGRMRNALKYSPDSLLKGNPRNNRFPCTICTLVDECRFYIATHEIKGDFENLATRSRYAIHSIRENALQPYKEIDEKIGSFLFDDLSFDMCCFKLDCGNRVDFFDNVIATEDYMILKRAATEKEIDEERIISIRTGRPTALFFHEENIRSPLLRLCYVGRLDERYTDGKDVVLEVGATSIPSKLHILLLKNALYHWKDLSKLIIVAETNVDLTHVELRAIDAFHRGTKRKIKQYGDVAPDIINKITEMKEKELNILFGTVPELSRSKST